MSPPPRGGRKPPAGPGVSRSTGWDPGLAAPEPLPFKSVPLSCPAGPGASCPAHLCPAWTSSTPGRAWQWLLPLSTGSWGAPCQPVMRCLLQCTAGHLLTPTVCTVSPQMAGPEPTKACLPWQGSSEGRMSYVRVLLRAPQDNRTSGMCK